MKLETHTATRSQDRISSLVAAPYFTAIEAANFLVSGNGSSVHNEGTFCRGGVNSFATLAHAGLCGNSYQLPAMSTLEVNSSVLLAAYSNGFGTLMVNGIGGVPCAAPSLATSACLPPHVPNCLSYIDGFTSPSTFRPNGQPLLSAQSVALQLVETASKGLVGAEEIEAWRSSLVHSFRGWQNEDASQRQFWLVYDALEPKRSYDLEFLSSKDFFSGVQAFNLAETRRDVTPWNSYRTLSARSIRLILDGVANELEKLDASCINTILAHLSKRVEKQVFAHVVCRRLSTQVATARFAQSTHTWVLGFVIHTGRSPPTSADRRSAIGRARASFAAAWMVDHETVLRPKSSTSLRNAICRRNTGARRNLRSQSYAIAGGRMRFAGCWGHRPHRSLAKCAQPIRS